MRISTNHFYANVLSSIHKEYFGAARAHEQIASGQRINRLSEDPAALSQILSLRTSTSEIDNYLMSIDQQISRLNRAEEALAQAVEVLQDARTIAVQGSTATYSEVDLKNLAFQVDQMITALVGFANASRGRITPEGMFARDDDNDRVIYDAPEIGDPENVNGEGWGRVLTLDMLVSTIDPGEVFGVEDDSIVGDTDGDGNPVQRATMFDTLFKLRNLLDPGTGDVDQAAISGLITDLDRHIDTLVQGRSDLGSRAYQLEKLSAQVDVQKGQLTEVLSKIGDTDVAEAMIRLSRHDLVLQATLSTATRLMNISLLNYLS